MEILNNPVVSGGFALMAGGALLATCRKVPESLWRWARTRLMYTVDIDNTDAAFSWVRAWLAARAKCRYVGAGVVPKVNGAGMQVYGPEAGPPKFHLFPLGVCTFRHRGKQLVAWASKEPATATTGFREVITIRRIGFGGREVLESILADAYAFVTGDDGPTVEVWVPDGSSWRLADRKPVRPAASLCLPDGVEGAVIDDARRFLADRQWYADRGIPWRRGYLLHGPPGNGKSSLAHALASKLGMSISVANLASFPSDAAMIECLGRVPRGHLLLLEDIDAAYSGRKANSNSPSFSGLLNALDGVTAQEGRVLVMTTNHVDALDPALIRPGRADVRLPIGNATHAQAAAMFRRFFTEAGEADAARFAGAAAGCSMARIQEHLLRHRGDMRAAVDGAGKELGMALVVVTEAA